MYKYCSISSTLSYLGCYNSILISSYFVNDPCFRTVHLATSHSRDGQHALLLGTGVSVWYQSSRLQSCIFCEISNDLMSSVRTMPPHREPRHVEEPSFPSVAQLGEAIANALQSVIRPSQRTPLESVHNLKITSW